MATVSCVGAGRGLVGTGLDFDPAKNRVGIGAAEDAKSVQSSDLRTPPAIEDLGFQQLHAAAVIS